MNHLAHFHLASIADTESPDGLILGALQADYTKGILAENMDRDLARGIQLHRQIDAFTDQHPELLPLRNAFDKPLRRYAGVLTDLSFDHFLAKNWASHDDRALPDFCDQVYALLQAHMHRLCPRTNIMAGRLAEYRVLTRYRDWSMVAASAIRLGERFSRGNPFLDVAPELDRLYPQMERSFANFYPQLVDRCYKSNPSLTRLE